ncbi:unnamed protein product, partial [Iphiclides podalirius]
MKAIGGPPKTGGPGRAAPSAPSAPLSQSRQAGVVLPCCRDGRPLSGPAGYLYISGLVINADFPNSIKINDDGRANSMTY